MAGIVSNNYPLFLRREIFRRIPALASDTSIALPPWLMKVSGTPVSGAIPIIAAILMNASLVRYVAMPTATSAPKRSGAFEAVAYPRSASAKRDDHTDTRPGSESAS